MVPMTCEVMSLSDGMATVLLDDKTKEGSTQTDRLLDIPLVRLELLHKEVRNYKQGACTNVWNSFTVLEDME